MEAQGPVLFAFRALDGWGIATEGGEVLLVRPPYGKCKPDVCRQSAEKAAAATPGFVRVDRRFRGWGYMFDHMTSEASALSVRVGLPGAQGCAQDLLRRVDVAGANAVLDRLASQACDGLDPLTRVDLLHAMRTSSGIYVNVRVVERIDDLLSKVGGSPTPQRTHCAAVAGAPQAVIA